MSQSTPQSLTVIITSSFVNILFHNVFDAVLCQMNMLDYMWKHLLFQFLLHYTCVFFVGGGGGFCTEDMY